MTQGYRHVATTHLSLERDLRPSMGRSRFATKEAIAPLINVSLCVNTCGVLLVEDEIPQSHVLEPLGIGRYTDRLGQLVVEDMSSTLTSPRVAMSAVSDRNLLV